MVPYKGPIAAMVQQLVGGLRAGMGYCGASSIRDLQARARFVQDLAGRAQGEPCPRRHHHEGSAELPARVAGRLAPRRPRCARRWRSRGWRLPRHARRSSPTSTATTASRVRHPASWRTRPGRAGRRLVPLLPRAARGPAEPRAGLGHAARGGHERSPSSEYAQSYLAGHTVASTRAEERQGVPRPVVGVHLGRRRDALPAAPAGRAAAASSASTRRATPSAVEQDAATLDEMWSSLTIERPGPLPGARSWQGSRRPSACPTSWRETRAVLGRRHAARAVREPAARRRPEAADGPRLALRDARGRAGRRRPARVLRRDPPQARRQLPGGRATRPSAAATST